MSIIKLTNKLSLSVDITAKNIYELKNISILDSRLAGLFKQNKTITIGYIVDKVGYVHSFINLVCDSFGNIVCIQSKDINGKCIHYTRFSDLISNYGV